jgi:ankyrin repeat protein
VPWLIGGGSYKETILAKILKRANYEMVEEVLVAGARVEPQSLIDASANPDVRVQRLLLNVVAGVEDLRASNGRTALHAVAMRGTVEHLRNVLSIDSVRAAQADINGVTPLWFAVMSKRMDMAFALCQHPQIIVFRPYRGDKFSDLVVERSEEHSEERSQLDLIIRMRQEKIENLDYFRDDFMQREEFISIRETARENPIEWFILAVGKNDFRAFKGALLHYPEISISTYNHTFAITVLHRALEVNISTDFMHMLLSLPGIDLRCINGAGETLAQVDAMHDNVKVLKMLSDLGAPMNTPDTIGVTPLMDAADRGCVNAVRYLLSIPGLDSGYRNYMGRNALDMAKSTRCYNVSIHKMLEEHSQRSCQLDVFRCMDYPLRHLRPKARV